MLQRPLPVIIRRAADRGAKVRPRPGHDPRGAPERGVRRFSSESYAQVWRVTGLPRSLASHRRDIDDGASRTRTGDLWVRCGMRTPPFPALGSGIVPAGPPCDDARLAVDYRGLLLTRAPAGGWCPSGWARISACRARLASALRARSRSGQPAESLDTPTFVSSAGGAGSASNRWQIAS
jgi:hypothetical protein